MNNMGVIFAIIKLNSSSPALFKVSQYQLLLNPHKEMKCLNGP
jgi:hypothetical protein